MKGRIEKVLAETLAASPFASLWRNPLVGYASAQAVDCADLKRLIAPSHLNPSEILPGAQSVVCFFLPFSKTAVDSNLPGRQASRLWCQAYVETNKVIAQISANLETLFQGEGYSVGKIPATHNFNEETLLSDWSHRHVAYLAGLGTFGLNNMLITQAGCCGRLGSLVTDFPFDSYGSPQKTEFCLFKQKGTCGVCQKKCVTDAYTPKGFDRFRCYQVCLENARLYPEVGYADVCGKCLVGLPCSLKNL